MEAYPPENEGGLIVSLSLRDPSVVVLIGFHEAAGELVWLSGLLAPKRLALAGPGLKSNSSSEKLGGVFCKRESMPMSLNRGAGYISRDPWRLIRRVSTTLPCMRL